MAVQLKWLYGAEQLAINYILQTEHFMQIPKKNTDSIHLNKVADTGKTLTSSNLRHYRRHIDQFGQ